MDINMLRRALWVFLRPLIQLVTNLLSPEVGEEWLRELKKFLRKKPCWVVSTTRLRYLVGVVVNATDGAETFQSSGLFTDGVYGMSVPTEAQGQARPGTLTDIMELVLGSTFTQIFGASSEDRLRWSESQVCSFVRYHHDKLRKDGLGTLFELEGGAVASVGVGNTGELRVCVDPLDYDYVWLAEYRRRIVVPRI